MRYKLFLVTLTFASGYQEVVKVNALSAALAAMNVSVPEGSILVVEEAQS